MVRKLKGKTKCEAADRLVNFVSARKEMIRYPKFLSAAGKSAAAQPNPSANSARSGSKATAAAGTGQTPRPSPPSIRWKGTANGDRCGQMPAPPQFRAARKFGHALGSSPRTRRRVIIMQQPIRILPGRCRGRAGCKVVVIRTETWTSSSRKGVSSFRPQPKARGSARR